MNPNNIDDQIHKNQVGEVLTFYWEAHPQQLELPGLVEIMKENMKLHAGVRNRRTE